MNIYKAVVVEDVYKSSILCYCVYYKSSYTGVVFTPMPMWSTHNNAISHDMFPAALWSSFKYDQMIVCVSDQYVYHHLLASCERKSAYLLFSMATQSHLLHFSHKWWMLIQLRNVSLHLSLISIPLQRKNNLSNHFYTAEKQWIQVFNSVVDGFRSKCWHFSAKYFNSTLCVINMYTNVSLLVKTLAKESWNTQTTLVFLRFHCLEVNESFE